MTGWALIGKQYQFIAGHYLWRKDWTDDMNVEVFDKCTRQHGHNYKVTVELGGQIKNDGMVLNYYRMNDIIEPIMAAWDHQNLNDLPEFLNKQPTAENIARILWHKIEDQLPVGIVLNYVEVKETDKTHARVER